MALPTIAETVHEEPSSTDYMKLLLRVGLGHSLIGFWGTNESWRSYWVVPNGGSQAVH